ncbi:MFS transporter [Arcanobacterium hippocoleae]
MIEFDGFTPRERHGKTQYLADRRIVFAVAYFGYAFCYLVRNNFKLTASPFAEQLGISAVDVGIILAAFPLAYAPGKLFMGLLADRTSMRMLLPGCVAFSALLCTVIPLVSSAAVLTVLMALLGLVQGAGAPAALGMISAWYPNPTRGAAVVAWNTSQNLGAGVLAAFAMIILEYFSNDWRLIFWIPALLSALFAIWLWKNGKNRPWQEGYPTLNALYGPAGVPCTAIVQRDSYWRLLFSALTSSPVLLLLLLLNALLYLLRFGVLNWITFYLPRTKGVSIAAAHNMFAVLEFMAIPTVVIFALLAWKWPSGMCAIGGISMLALALSLMFYAYVSDLNMVFYASTVLGGLIYAPQVIINVLTVNLMPPRMVGAAVGAVGLSGYLVGEILANTVVPVVAQNYGWPAVYLGLAGVALLTAGVYFWLRPYEKSAVVLSGDSC